MVKILSIGKGTQDVFLKSDEFDPHKEGRHMYTHLPLGLKMEVEDVHFCTGGNATNVAVTFARQGLESGYLWGLGDDPASASILRELDEEGVNTSHVVQKPEYQSGYSVIMIATNGERTILNHRGKAFGRTGRHNFDLAVIGSYDWIYPTSLGDGGLPLLHEIVSTAARHKVKVMLNPAGPELADPARLKTILEDVEVLCCNKEEMSLLVAGATCEELALHALSYVPVAIVSDGPNGVVATDGKTIVRAGMYEDVPVVDRTGAGDAFASGFLSQWSQGKSLKQSIIFASANSTSVVTKIGAKAGILPKSVRLHEMPIHERPVNLREAPHV
ncbi:carbohydrate kinase family protein [Candidatus Saccharibacteria bacterium]|nr:MAG: carbohydrate kinase family protein [Candidatus Saccharibacteria bacterium]